MYQGRETFLVLLLCTYHLVPSYSLHPLHPRVGFSVFHLFLFSLFSFWFWVITRPHISVTAVYSIRISSTFFLEIVSLRLWSINSRWTLSKIIFWLYRNAAVGFIISLFDKTLQEKVGFIIEKIRRQFHRSLNHCRAR